MRKVILGLSAVALMASGAGAVLSPPKQAKAFKSEVIKRYSACTSPNTSAGTLSLNACNPAVIPGACGFDPLKGKGIVKTTVKGSASSNNGDIQIEAKVTGITSLGPGCGAGTVLCPAATVRVSTSGCTTPGDCTIADLSDFQTAVNDGNALTFECCTLVEKPALSGLFECSKIKQTVNTGGLPSNTLQSNKSTQFELRGIGLRNQTNGQVEFVAGALIP
jgi:hypothetical protein